jgi:hypothetical protein
MDAYVSAPPGGGRHFFLHKFKQAFYNRVELVPHHTGHVMGAGQMDEIRQRLEHELSTIERAADHAHGPERLALETLARVFRQRLTDLPLDRRIPPPRVQDVLPPAHQYAGG